MNIAKNEILIFETGNTAGQPVVFVHGFPYDHNMWNRVTEVLAEDYHCITYDIRGLGMSDPGDGQNTMEMFVNDLFYVIDKMNLDKPALCGLSMGGYISLRAVEKDESRFSRLILCDTKASSDPDEVKLKRQAGIKKINEEGVQKYAADFVPACFAKESIDRLGDEYIAVMGRAMNSNPAGVKGCLLAMLSRTDTTGYLPQIKIPTLVLCGEKDALSTPDAMREMAGKINNSRFIIVPEAGHMTPIENPGFVSEQIKKFMISSLPTA